MNGCVARCWFWHNVPCTLASTATSLSESGVAKRQIVYTLRLLRAVRLALHPLATTYVAMYSSANSCELQIIQAHYHSAIRGNESKLSFETVAIGRMQLPASVAGKLQDLLVIFEHSGAVADADQRGGGLY